MHENSQKLQTNTWWVVFGPKPSERLFWSFYCCFPPIWSNNAQNKTTRPEIPKPAKNRNQPQITSFFTHIFLYIIFGHFVIFLSARMKNIPVKSSSLYAWKLSKLRNQHIMTSFCTQTINTSFLAILLLFPTNMLKKSTKQNNRTLNTKTCQK